MAETDWLGMLGGLAGQVGGAYLGAYAGNPQWGAQVGGALGSSLGSATSQETGLTEGAGYDPNAMYGSFSQGMSGGGGGMGGMGSLMGMFGGGGGGGGGGMGGAPMYRAPMMSTGDLFNIAGGMGPMLAESGNAFNFARQPGYTQSQLNAEQQINPGLFDVRNTTTRMMQDDLNRGYNLDPALTNMVLSKFLEEGGRSGAGASDLSQRFGQESLLRAGINQRELALNRGLQNSRFDPGNYTPLDPWGQTPLLTAAMDFRGAEATQNNMANANMAIQAAAQQKQTADYNNYLAQARGMMGGAGGASTPTTGGTGSAWDAYNKGIGTPPINQGSGNPADRTPSGGFDWSKIFANNNQAGFSAGYGPY